MSDDNDAIGRVLGGDADAFRALVERYQRPVLSLVRGLVGDAHRAEDVAQEAFLAAYRNLERFDGARCRFSTWLFTIARNTALSALGGRRRPEPVSDPPSPPDRRTPDEALAGRELFAQLDQALAALPAQEKTAFVLAELVGLPHEEIADIEQVAVGTARSRLSRAKARLRSLLGEYAGGVS